MTENWQTLYSCADCNNYKYKKQGVCNVCITSSVLNGKPAYWNNDTIISTEQGNALTAKHYQTADIQPIEIMQMYFRKEEMIGYLRGNILKYNLRYRNKDIQAKEAAKLAQYSAWLDDVENGRKIDPRKGGRVNAK